MPLDVYASHSYEAGVQGDAIPDNTQIDLSQLTLESTGVFPLYDASPNFISGHFLLRAPCEDVDPEEEPPEIPRPLVTVIAGHIDELESLTHVDKIPLYYIGHASTAGSCVYHAHLPDPLEGGSPRITDVDLVNYSPIPIVFNAGDAVDINVQRSLGNIGNYYENNVLLPLQLSGLNPVIDLNQHEEAQDANDEAQDANVQQTQGNQIQNYANDVILPPELSAGDNKVLNVNDEQENGNDKEDDNKEVDDNKEEEKDE